MLDSAVDMVLAGLEAGLPARRLGKCPTCDLDCWWHGTGEFVDHAIACAKIAAGLARLP